MKITITQCTQEQATKIIQLIYNIDLPIKILNLASMIVKIFLYGEYT